MAFKIIQIGKPKELTQRTKGIWHADRLLIWKKKDKGQKYNKKLKMLVTNKVTQGGFVGVEKLRKIAKRNNITLQESADKYLQLKKRYVSPKINIQPPVKQKYAVINKEYFLKNPLLYDKEGNLKRSFTASEKIQAFAKERGIVAAIVCMIVMLCFGYALKITSYVKDNDSYAIDDIIETPLDKTRDMAIVISEGGKLINDIRPWVNTLDTVDETIEQRLYEKSKIAYGIFKAFNTFAPVSSLKNSIKAIQIVEFAGCSIALITGVIIQCGKIIIT